MGGGLRRMTVGGGLRRKAVGGGLRRMAVGGVGGGGSSSGIVFEIVNWKLIGEGGRELADFGLVTIIFTYSPHRIIRILQSPMGVHKEKGS